MNDCLEELLLKAPGWHQGRFWSGVREESVDVQVWVSKVHMDWMLTCIHIRCRMTFELDLKLFL